MGSLPFSLLAICFGIILAVVGVFVLFVRIISRYSRSRYLYGKSLRNTRIWAIVFSFISFGLLCSIVIVGHGFFNYPHHDDVSGKIVETTWPYIVERVAFGLTAITSMILWVRCKSRWLDSLIITLQISLYFISILETKELSRWRCTKLAGDLYLPRRTIHTISYVKSHLW